MEITPRFCYLSIPTPKVHWYDPSVYQILLGQHLASNTIPGDPGTVQQKSFPNFEIPGIHPNTPRFQLVSRMTSSASAGSMSATTTGPVVPVVQTKDITAGSLKSLDSSRSGKCCATGK